MEHTNEFLQMMHCAYMGCNVIDTKADRVGKVISANTTRVWYEHPNNKINSRPTQSFAFYGECKPILTPLSEITDEDAVDVAKIFKYQVNEQDKLKFLGLELVDSLVKYELDGFMLRDILAITDYLRSKHYDLGYLHIPSLIEAGLAVKATK